MQDELLDELQSDDKSEKTVAELVGSQIRRIREERKCTLEQLSRIVRVSVQTPADIESGSNTVNLDELISIINALRCSSDDVFNDVINNKSIINKTHLYERLCGMSYSERKNVIKHLDAAMTMTKNFEN